LRHHVSVLSKRNHGLQKEVDRLKKEEVAVVSEVASPERVEEPEPLVVAEPKETVEAVDMAEAFVASAGVAGVRLARVATPEMAELIVAEDDDEDDCCSVVTVTGKKRRLDDGGDVGGVEEVNGDRLAMVVPVGPRGGAPAGPRLMAERVGGIRRGSGVPADLFVRRAYRFVDRSLIGVRNGMVGNTYHTRGNFAHAPDVGRGGYRGRGYRPYR